MSKTLKIIVGVVVTLVVLIGVGAGTFLLMPTIVGAARAGSLNPTSTANTTATPAPDKKQVNQFIKQYVATINQQLAQGLKLTPDQLTAQLRSGKTLTQIATELKVTGSQFTTLIATALQNSLQPAITSGKLTQMQVANLVKRAQKNPDQLGHLLIAQTNKKGTPTP